MLALKKTATLSSFNVDTENLCIRIFMLGQESQSTARILQELVTTQSLIKFSAQKTPVVRPTPEILNNVV
jgi:hypothetical protein